MEQNDTYVYGVELLRGETVIARYGRLQNALIAKREIKGEVFMAEIDWKKVLKAYSKHKVKYTPLPKFPAIQRDISMIVPDNVAYNNLSTAIQSCNPKLIREVGITDVYKGDRIGILSGNCLEYLEIASTHISKAGVKRLRKALPNCRVVDEVE